MKTVILIMIIAGSNDGGRASIEAEFNSMENCITAGKSIESIYKSKSHPYRFVEAWGCYEK